MRCNHLIRFLRSIKSGVTIQSHVNLHSVNAYIQTEVLIYMALNSYRMEEYTAEEIEVLFCSLKLSEQMEFSKKLVQLPTLR